MGGGAWVGLGHEGGRWTQTGRQSPDPIMGRKGEGEKREKIRKRRRPVRACVRACVSNKSAPGLWFTTLILRGGAQADKKADGWTS